MWHAWSDSRGLRLQSVSILQRVLHPESVIDSNVLQRERERARAREREREQCAAEREREREKFIQSR
jgi:hypothetical protein